jgi:hypothetical protein
MSLIRSRFLGIQPAAHGVSLAREKAFDSLSAA